MDYLEIQTKDNEYTTQTIKRYETLAKRNLAHPALLTTMYEMVLPFVGISFNIKIGDALNILSWPYNQAHCVYPAMFKAAITQLSPEIRTTDR